MNEQMKEQNISTVQEYNTSAPSMDKKKAKSKQWTNNSQHKA